MAAHEDDFRVEARLGSAGRGLGATPEHIEALQQRLQQQTKLTQRRPAKGFGEIMAESTTAAAALADADAPVPTPTPAAARLPTPRPGLRHPREGAAYGVVRKLPVILKG